MAARLSTEQIAEIVEIVGAVDKIEGLPHLVRILRESSQTAFSAEELDGVDAAISALDRPAAERPTWPAQIGRGLFFVFEGLDRSGKSTQSKLLTKHLEEKGPVKWMCFPNRATAIGTLIDLYLLRKLELPDEAVHLLFSANRWESVEALVSDLNAGTTIVCDRYAFSGVAYTAAKGLDFAWCQAPDIGLPTPDGIFYLFVDPKVGAARANFGDERYENAGMQSAVRVEFQRPELRLNVAWHDVDGARDIQEIHAEIRSAVDETQRIDQENPVKPIQRLWTA